ncbi:replication protein A 70 kDa DNA-binding subunit B-like isoform X1 [Panicum virgatum]|nr:replication protein A 70 kDa DNA-binding subunit B-like isoform X1 [Panicum virgatum]XP_039789882.1 replication protein A 70 kDa DNA-binding subunit B-like isoform X1 [Panicum virgatum]XP_039804386.1 replication protein A 70 kDa DNA-binding subunit B-like isoform X1 [Panicum virgatum]KAG2651375.1 hypothetical protein PVAP13_1NG283338 [Panicum virgatum]
MSYSPLVSLTPKDRLKTIFVRVIRKWEFRGINDDGPLQHIDLILADTQGSAIYAEIPPTEAEKHGRIIQPCQNYIMSRFRICNAKDYYKSVQAPYMLELTCHTRVSHTEEPGSFPNYVYNLTPFSELQQFVGDRKKFHDVLGILIEAAEPEWISFSNQPKPNLRRNILLRDATGNEVRVSLWGQKASAFNIDNLNDSSGPSPTTILLTGCLVKTFQGQLYLSGHSACHWYINPEIPESETLLQSVGSQNITVRKTGTPLEDLPVPQTQQNKEHLTLREMQDIDPYEFPEKGCMCTVTITRLIDASTWWFPSCNFCNKSCKQEGCDFICYECGTTNKFSYKYKLNFITSDGTEEAEMICFGEIGRRIVGKPVETVMRTPKGNDLLPLDVAGIVSSKFTFTVLMTEKSYRVPKKSYRITSIVTAYGKQKITPSLSQNAPQSSQDIGTSDKEIAKVETISAASCPSSSQLYGLLTPTKTLPIQSMHLQTPEKSVLLSSKDADVQVVEDAEATNKSAKKRLYTSVMEAEKSKVPNKSSDKDMPDIPTELAKNDAAIPSLSTKMAEKQEPINQEKAIYGKGTKSSKK